MQIIHAMGTDAPPYHQRGWFLPFLQNSLDGIFHLWHIESVFPKNKRHFHCMSVHLRWRRAQRTWRCFCAKFINASVFAEYNFNLHFLIQWRAVFSDNHFPKYSWAHVVVWRFLTKYPEGSMVTRIQQLFLPLAFNRYYELWMVKDLNSLQSCAEKHCLWTDWQFYHNVWHKVVNHDPSLLSKTRP